MALQDPIITISDVRTIRDVDATYSEDRFTGYLNEIQDIYLKQLLGDALWYDFFNNIGDAKYQTLIDGETYTYSSETIYYPGSVSYTHLTLPTKA